MSNEPLNRPKFDEYKGPAGYIGADFPEANPVRVTCSALQAREVAA